MAKIDFDRLMAAILHGDGIGRIAVAVSGGADSMALCLLADQWAKSNDIALQAVIVDHGLRPGSADEAATVGGWLAARNIDHQILVWQEEKPEAGIQAAARKARYRLMTDWCIDNQIKYLLVAHHLEDQVETFLMRLHRGSGVDGLASMALNYVFQNVQILRPLLTQSKKQLKEFLKESNQDWIEDPSNQDPAYARTQIRALVGRLEDHGLSTERLGGIVRQFSSLKQFLQLPVNAFVESQCHLALEGYATFDLAVLKQLPDAIISRVIIRLVGLVGGGEYPPRQKKLLRAVNVLKQGNVSGFTLGGCNFLVSVKTSGSHEIMICREAREKSRVQVSAGDAIVWRNVFDLQFESFNANPDMANDGGTNEKVYLRPLGKSGWAKIIKDRPDLKDISVPFQVRLTLPALFDQRGVFEAPLLGYRREAAIYDTPPPPVTFKLAHFKALTERDAGE